MDALIAGASIGSIFNAAIEKTIRPIGTNFASLQDRAESGKAIRSRWPCCLNRGRLACNKCPERMLAMNQAEIIPAVFPDSCAALHRRGYCRSSALAKRFIRF